MAILFSGVPVQAADKPIELRLAHMFPVGSPSHQHIEAWAKKIAADSGGRLTIRIFPVNTLLPHRSSMTGWQTGLPTSASVSGIYPRGYTLGVTFPFIMGAPDVVTATKVYDEVWKKFPNEMAEEWKEAKVLGSLRACFRQ